MRFKIHVTTEDGELLDTQNIDTDEINWDSTPTRHCVGNEIFDEINRAIKQRGDK